MTRGSGSSSGAIPTITPQAYDAVLFDLDGVITDTASLHSLAWAEMFDEFLARRAEETGEPFVAFGPRDYALHVDGKPRYDGVAGFLAARSITLERGEPADDGSADTVSGLGNRKNELFNELLARRGPQMFEDGAALLHGVRALGIRTAVVSSSANCEAVLQAVGLADQFDAWVDGVVSARLGLPGKPAPDAFLEGARQLGVAPARAVVIEDALVGVAAGRAGGFGLVVGVDRHDDADALVEAGADVAVSDLRVLLPGVGVGGGDAEGTLRP